MRTRVKICGLTRAEDALLAADLGADFVGVVLAPSPRRCDPAEARKWLPEARERGARAVGVFVAPSAAELAEAVEALGLDLVQVHGLPAAVAPTCPWIRAGSWADARAWIRETQGRVRAPRAPEGIDPSPPNVPAPWGILADTGATGGTGRSFDWGALAGWRSWTPGEVRLFLAGGLSPETVGAAIAAVRPWAVDASSRLEAEAGRKEPGRMRAFLDAVRRADEAPDRGDRAEGTRTR
jgi:phosphoribosylanthranilate isomerase